MSKKFIVNQVSMYILYTFTTFRFNLQTNKNNDRFRHLIIVNQQIKTFLV